jgi:hypothetical protein
MKKTLFILFVLLPVFFLLPSITLAIGQPKEIAESVARAVKDAAIALAVLGFAVAAIMFITATGNPEQVNRAKTVLLWAVIGTAVALIAGGAREFVTTLVGG